MPSRAKSGAAQPPAYLSQVFYPRGRLVGTKSHAFLIGWNLQNFRCCISSIVELPYSEDNVALIQSALKNTGELANIFQSCSNTDGATPVLLGEWCPALPADFAPSPARQVSGIWIVLSLREGSSSASAERHSSDTESDEPTSSINSSSSNWRHQHAEEERRSSGPGTTSPQPHLHSIYSLGCSYKTSSYMIEYTTIDTDKLCCLELESTDSSLAPPPEAAQKLLFAAPVRAASGPDLSYIAAQINSSQDLHNNIAAYIECSKSGSGGSASKQGGDYYNDDKHNKSGGPHAFYRSLKQQLRRALLAPLRWLLLLSTYLWTRCLGVTVALLSTKSSILLRILPLDYWLGQDTGSGKPDDSDSSSRSVALSDVSLCCAHLCARAVLMQTSLAYCAHFPRSWKVAVATRQLIWTSVCSCSSTVLADLLLGCLFGLYLYNGCDSIVARLSALCTWLQSRFLLASLRWLNRNPGGLLLHPFVTQKLGDVLTWLVDSFGRALALPQLHRALVRATACLGTLGLSVQLAFLVDAARLLSFHIATIHRLLALLHSFQVNLIYSLYCLFQGQKKNILRRRVDTCVYDMQQLLFGTVLFAIVFFLFPSFAAYFYLFALLQLMVVGLEAAIWLVVVLLVSFPYYTLFASAGDPYISRGLQFKLVSSSARSGRGKKAVKFTDVHEEIGSDDDSCYDSSSSPRTQGAGSAAAKCPPTNKLLSLVRSKRTSGRPDVAPSDVIYLSLSATPLTTGALLLPLGLWSSLMHDARRGLLRVHSGFFSGRPSLDLQLIQLSAALAEARLGRSNAAFCADEIFFASIAGSWGDARRACSQAVFWAEAKKVHAALSAVESGNKACSSQLRLSSCLFQLVLCTHTVSQLLCCCGAVMFIRSLLSPK